MEQPASALTGIVSELLVLRLLAEREMYGYELAKAVLALTRKEVRLREGLLYPLLHDLEQRGLLRARKLIVAGRPRIYYRATARGNLRRRRLTEQWQRAREAVSAVLEGARHV
jgi:PadR family transcriptional regulator, regulatory protein PadR